LTPLPASDWPPNGRFAIAEFPELVTNRGGLDAISPSGLHNFLNIPEGTIAELLAGLSFDCAGDVLYREHLAEPFDLEDGKRFVDLCGQVVFIHATSF